VIERPESPRRGGHWYLLTGLLIGLALGLVYAWKISPVRYVDTDPAALRADFKDQYRLTIASAYLATGNLARAQARLALLQESDPLQAINDQAQRWLGQGKPAQEREALLALASALRQSQPAAVSSPSLPNEPSLPAQPGATDSLTPSASGRASSAQTPSPSATPTRTRLPPASPTPRPTHTPTPTPGAPFRLSSHQTICDPALPEGLLQIEVRDGSGKAIAGVEIVITWQGGEEHFFTGLKPEMGNGYADYQMTPGVLYALRLLPASTLVTDLSAPSCNDQGTEYWGGLRLIFEQR